MKFKKEKAKERVNVAGRKLIKREVDLDNVKTVIISFHLLVVLFRTGNYIFKPPFFLSFLRLIFRQANFFFFVA